LHDHRTGEDADDLLAWLQSLPGCPSIDETALASCGNPSHGDEAPTWFYVEADPAAGIARRRCLGCGTVHHMLDSQQHWHAGVHTAACPTCAQSMFEIAAGMHTEPGTESDERVVTWVALGVRCVTCGRVDGVTDLFVPRVPLAAVTAAL
jgi:hypothetical protein